MTSAMLDQDFGSESEDDNFNPAPADDSDGDDKVDEKAEDLTGRKPLSSSSDVKEEDGDVKDTEDHAGNTRMSNNRDLDDDDQEEPVNGGVVDDDEDEEDAEEEEDEDEDEDEVISV